ncbi:histidine phosphatase family protein [Streptomyces kanamyceticus]|uniref:Histidine phosphatase family protein n=1 Tax=Streptomyces kanamyceticus TaxID=1967 RepID=A0A5J6GN71_STRKN|nr:histidine phosphatase family protein [Streptomyces kanamyceticus]QEU96859.1 histidine phosphatase family protein [Streptomyces kanamyceticus]
MTSRVLLVSPAMTASLRQARFDDGAPLDDRGRADARAAAGSLPADAPVVTSASARCQETARALGLAPSGSPAELAGMEMGHWRGRSLDEVTASEPAAVARWLTEPEFAPTGGESVVGFCARVARWLDAAAAGGGRVVAVVEPEVVRAAVVHATGAPPAAFWRLDVEPLTVTELSGRAGRWNVRLGRPVKSL